jgi:hypothetical protein
VIGEPVEIPHDTGVDVLAPLPSSFPRVEYKRPSTVDPDRVRYRLAVLLAVAFLATIGFSFWGAMRGTTTWDNVKEWLQAVLPAVTAVVSTAVGFYFGTQQKSGG